MKKITLIGLLATTLALAGCASTTPPPSTVTAPPGQETGNVGIIYEQVQTPRGLLSCVRLYQNGIDCDWEALR